MACQQTSGLSLTPPPIEALPPELVGYVLGLTRPSSVELVGFSTICKRHTSPIFLRQTDLNMMNVDLPPSQVAPLSDGRRCNGQRTMVKSPGESPVAKAILACHNLNRSLLQQQPIGRILPMAKAALLPALPGSGMGAPYEEPFCSRFFLLRT